MSATIRATLTIKVWPDGVHTETGEADTVSLHADLVPGRWTYDLYELQLKGLGWLEANHG